MNFLYFYFCHNLLFMEHMESVWGQSCFFPDLFKFRVRNPHAFSKIPQRRGHEILINEIVSGVCCPLGNEHSDWFVCVGILTVT